MATKGRRPKPPVLKLVTGNPGKRRVPAPAPIPVRRAPLDPPKLTKPQRALWDRFVESAWWLTDFDVPKAYMWVALQAEFMADPAAMVAARIAQLRILGAELGLDPASRGRMPSTPEATDPADKYFA